MKRPGTTLLAALAALLLSVRPSQAAVPQEAMDLYSRGMYARAMTLFLESDDPVSRDYAVLCAIGMDLPQAAAMVGEADSLRLKSVLNNEIHHRYGLKLFDKGRYSDALTQLETVNPDGFTQELLSELHFKLGHCLADAECLYEASLHFEKVDSLSRFATAAWFNLGTCNYRSSRFGKAVEWFSMASSDERFKDLCDFYILDCKFMLGDYDYVVTEGEKLFGTLGESRSKHISRLISEASLVKGDARKAKDFLMKENLPDSGASNKDLYHAASVLYATGDYKGAAGYFAAMKPGRDSLWQLSRYHLADAYVKTGNKILAMDAFGDAASLDFSQEVKEDACFNHAKLAFDLNSDVKPFRDYMDKYGTSRKGEVIYSYLAITALCQRDYKSAVEAYDMIENLDSDQKRNYIKANFLYADQLHSSGSFEQASKYLRYASVYLDKSDALGQLCRYYLAEDLFRSERYQQALGMFTDLYNASALNGRPQGWLLPYNISYCYFQQGNFDAAARWMDKYLSSRRQKFRKDALLRRADCDFARKDYKAATVSYQKYLDEAQGEAGIYPRYQLGLAFGLCSDLQRKAEVLSPVLKASPSEELYCQALHELSRTYLELGKDEQAGKAFRLLRGNASDSTYAARAIIGLATLERNASRQESAMALYRKVIGMLPGSEWAEDALMNLKSIYVERGEPDKFQAYVDANGLGSSLSAEELEQMYFAAAEQLFLSGKNSSDAFAKYLSKYPKGAYLAQTYYYLGEQNRLADRRQKACSYYEKSLEVSSEGSFAELSLMALADTRYALELYDSAFDAYLSLCNTARISDNRSAALLGLMRSAWRSKKYEEALEAASQVLKTASDESLRREILYVQAKSYLQTSRRKQAFGILNELRKQPATPEGAEAYYLIIRSQYDWGNYESVQNDVYDFAEKCGEQNYWLAKAFLVLGDSFVKTGNAAQARVTYQSVLDGYEPGSQPDDVLSEAAQKIEAL